MDYLGLAFGMMGFLFGVMSYTRLDKLEKELKSTGVLEPEFKSL
ncbi:MAG: hypothetical protein ACRD2J_04925 [Thermoanaerobaculia bacterium]